MDVAHEQLLASAQKGLNTGSESFVSLDARSACRCFSGSSWTQSCYRVLGSKTNVGAGQVRFEEIGLA
jgi:hypothetical protein